jgi:hypothetical protein
MIYHFICLVVEPTPLKNHGVKVSWDNDIPNLWKTIQKSMVPNHQPVIVDHINIPTNYG